MIEVLSNHQREPESTALKPADSLEEVRKQLAEIRQLKEDSEKKAADYLNRLQRLQADMENLQKITKRQIETVTSQASERLILKLLPILDSLQQATNIAHSSNQLPKEEIAVGLNMLLKKLMGVLQTEGFEDIPAVGQMLDLSKHEAVSFIEKDDVPENTITDEVRKGYMLNGKVIRQSLVVVSKPKSSSEDGTKPAIHKQ